MSRKNANANATPKTVKLTKAQAAQQFAALSADFIGLVNQSATSEQTVRSLRPQLEHTARQLFPNPLTVADAAERIGLELSVKGMVENDPQRAVRQRQRVTLGRALRDAGLLATDSNNGRPAGSTESDDADKGDTKDKKTPLDVILSLLPQLSEAEMDKLTNAIMAQLGTTAEA